MMAEVVKIDNDLVLKLSPLEKLGAFHGSLRVNQNSIVSIKEIPNPWRGPDGLNGVRAQVQGFLGS